MKRAAQARAEIDLHDNGPLRRADGVRAYNSHFWPMAGDSYWYREFDRQHPYLLSATHLDWIGVIELNNGAWLAGHGIARMNEPQFPTREAAFRARCREVVTNAARSYARRPTASWDRPLPADQYAAACKFANWVLATEEANGWSRKIEPEDDA